MCPSNGEPLEPGGLAGWLKPCLIGLGLLLGTAALAEPTRIAAAADLRFAMDDIIDLFHQAHGDAHIEAVYGSSGRFRSQIANGAPFDLFFSADLSYVEALQAEGLAAGPIRLYGIGRIVLWSATRDVSGMNLHALTDPAFRRVAIANPRHAPYGDRAREAMQSAGVWDDVEPRLVYGENIGQALQLVESRAADIGVIALALALNPRIQAEGRHALIDADLHRPLEQGFIVTRRAAENPVALAFADFMDSPAARAVMVRYGFELPER